MEANLCDTFQTVSEVLDEFDWSRAACSWRMNQQIGRRLVEQGQMPSVLGCAYQAGVLSRLLPALAQQGLRPTVAIGTSAGAINASLWASYAHLRPDEISRRLRGLWVGTDSDDIFRNPQHPYLKALMNAVPHFDMKPGERLVSLREIDVGERMVSLRHRPAPNRSSMSATVSLKAKRSASSKP